ncbi:hypothetical protein RJ53_07810 [Methanocalculus chunghsingensis]|uniref:Uncharacterized protein n=1 Tax=Methanocalculus chunghsingensis TaxID=156457 RepID=A0A8J8B5R6_9EURY|nr:hypothetical protein [Methanocalculus chunghsingensis]MBR1369403.1 hypothetical protein [Methanocalculus chunghsingensis]
MGFGASFARDWTISKTSRFFGKNRIADPLLGRLAADPSEAVREAVARHASALGAEEGAGFRRRVPDDEVLLIVESFLLTAGVPYDRKNDNDIVIKKDFSASADQGLCCPLIASSYLTGFLAAVLESWERIETDEEIRCRKKETKESF